MSVDGEARARLEAVAERVLGKAQKKTAVAGAAAPREAKESKLQVSGTGNIVAGRDVHNITLNIRQAPPKLVIVKTGDGVLDAKQKRKLLDVRDEIVALSRLMSNRKPLTQAAVMANLNRHMDVNRYDEIKAVDFERALVYMMVQRARLDAAPAARAKSPDWRNRRISAIHARCKEMGWERWRKDYMLVKFQRRSMVEMPDAEIESLYRAVMAKNGPE